MCTYFNDITTDKCLSCNSPKEISSENKTNQIINSKTSLGIKHTKEWICEICSHRNRANTIICELCEKNVENIINDEIINSRSSINERSINLESDYFNSTMNPSLTYRSQKAMSTLKVYF